MAWDPPGDDNDAFNRWVIEFTRDLPPIWESGPVLARKSREEGRSVFGPLQVSDRAETMHIDGPAGPLLLRVFRASEPTGVFLHIHGGGWVVGGSHHHDRMLEHLVDDTGLTVVSVEYRLAPEDPYPAAPDDCEAAAAWLVDHATREFGTTRLIIGGESAGAHLAAVTLLRTRDRYEECPFEGAALAYGIYDMRGTPSVEAFGDQSLVLDASAIRWFVAQFAPDRDLTDPDVSPLFGDLTGMPPAIFSIGTMDPLFDDTLFMEARWRAAGNETELAVWPGRVHAFDYFDTPLGRDGRRALHRFLSRV